MFFEGGSAGRTFAPIIVLLSDLFFCLLLFAGQMPILISSVVSLYFLEWSDLFKPVLVGFSCRDRSLSLPYIEPTHELVPLLMLLSLAFAGPAISVSRRLPGGPAAASAAPGCGQALC